MKFNATKISLKNLRLMTPQIGGIYKYQLIVYLRSQYKNSYVPNLFLVQIENRMNKNIEVTLVLLYAVPSIVLYAGIIFMLIRRFKKKEFCSPFYKLFLVNGILVSLFMRSTNVFLVNLGYTLLDSALF